MPPVTSRPMVYKAIDTERDYQDRQAGNSKPHEERIAANPDKPMDLSGFILCMEKTLHDAREAWYRGASGQREALPFIRKTAALGVAAMENYGAPPRE